MNKNLISVHINSMEESIEKAKNNYEQEVLKYKKIINMLRALCPHDQEDLEYYPDPSGNNDSYYVCKNCGQEKKRQRDFYDDKKL